MATLNVVAENGISKPPRSALIFLGTGCSSAVPNALCLIRPSDQPCRVCSQSLSIPPEQNPNYRFFICWCQFVISICVWNSFSLSPLYILMDILGKCIFWRVKCKVIVVFCFCNSNSDHIFIDYLLFCLKPM